MSHILECEANIKDIELLKEVLQDINKEGEYNVKWLSNKDRTFRIKWSKNTITVDQNGNLQVDSDDIERFSCIIDLIVQRYLVLEYQTNARLQGYTCTQTEDAQGNITLVFTK